MNPIPFNFSISQPGNILKPSLLDLATTDSSLFPTGTTLDAWCLDKRVDLNTDDAYSGTLYSAYDATSISSALPNIARYVDRLDSVNWLLNYHDGSNPQYNWGEVQSAIWTLLGQDYISELPYTETAGLVTVADVDDLVRQALAHDGYRPGEGEIQVMVVDPVKANGEHAQPLLVEVKPAPIHTRCDEVQVCEDQAVTFNVLANDSPGLRLVGVTHVSSNLDATFNSRGGAVSFTQDGKVTYKTMANYYGNDKLVYTVEDAFGNRSTQTVNMHVEAVSDAMVTTDSTQLHPANLNQWSNWYDDKRDVRHRVHVYKLSDFTAGSNDNADQLQTFADYNTGVANDVDSVTQVRISGLQGSTAAGAQIKYNGKVLDFSAGQVYDIPVAMIRAGKLSIDIHTTHKNYDLKYQLGDSGTVHNDGCCEGSNWSGLCHTYIGTPIALDLNNDGRIGVTGATASYQKDAGAVLGQTVEFDLNGDGAKDTIEWFDGSGDGILIDNRDGNAANDMSGLRLFGDQGGAYGNGYYKLAALDANLDGKLSGLELDGIALWVDNGDAVVQTGEIQALGQHAIDAISTQLSMTYDTQGKLHIQSTATRADGSTLLSEDVFFAGVGANAPTLADVLGNDATLDSVLGAAPPATNDVFDTFAQCFAPDTSAATEVLRNLVAAHASAEVATTA